MPIMEGVGERGEYGARREAQLAGCPNPAARDLDIFRGNRSVKGLGGNRSLSHASIAPFVAKKPYSATNSARAFWR